MPVKLIHLFLCILCISSCDDDLIFIDAVNNEVMILHGDSYTVSDIAGDIVYCDSDEFSLCILEPIPIIVGVNQRENFSLIDEDSGYFIESSMINYMELDVLIRHKVYKIDSNDCYSTTHNHEEVILYVSVYDCRSEDIIHLFLKH